MLGLSRKSPPPPAQWRTWATAFTLRLAAGGAAVPGRTFADAIDDATRAAGIKPADVRGVTVARFERDSAVVILRFHGRNPVPVTASWPGIAAAIINRPV